MVQSVVYVYLLTGTGKKVNLDIRETTDHSFAVVGLHTVAVHSLGEAYHYIKLGSLLLKNIFIKQSIHEGSMKRFHCTLKQYQWSSDTGLVEV